MFCSIVAPTKFGVGVVAEMNILSARISTYSFADKVATSKVGINHQIDVKTKRYNDAAIDAVGIT